MTSGGSTEVSSSPLLSFLRVHRNRKMAMAPKANASIGSRNRSKCLLLVGDLLWHGGNLRRVFPHSPTLPTKDSEVRFEKTPPSGIWPSRLLNERFKVVKYVKLARNMGMLPERLLNERSNDAKLLSFSSGPGIEPLKELCDRFR